MPSRELCYKQVELVEGWIARVGRSDLDNDELTFRVSFPQDWWLHVKGCSGSHVVIHREEGGEPSRAVLDAAGLLAAQNSKARSAGRAAIHIARICDLTKPKGAPPGTVEVRKGKSIVVRWPLR